MVESLQCELQERTSQLEACQQRPPRLSPTRTPLPLSSTSFSFSASCAGEVAALSEQVAALQHKLAAEEASKEETEKQLEEVNREKDSLSSRLWDSKEELEDLTCQVDFYRQQVEDLRRQMADTQAEKEAGGVQRNSSKGNSLFAEVDDRRQLLEKSVSVLKSQKQQLKDKVDGLRQELNKYKLQLAMNLDKAGREKEKALIEAQQERLAERASEITHLRQELYHKDKKSEEFESLLNKAEDKNYAQYLISIIEYERKRNGELEGELHSKTLQFLDATNQLLQQRHHEKELEMKNCRLQAQIIKLEQAEMSESNTDQTEEENVKWRTIKKSQPETTNKPSKPLGHTLSTNLLAQLATSTSVTSNRRTNLPTSSSVVKTGKDTLAGGQEDFGNKRRIRWEGEEENRSVKPKQIRSEAAPDQCNPS